MDVHHNSATAFHYLLKDIHETCGNWPDQQPPSPFQLSCLEALVETGCPVVARPQVSDVPGDHSNQILMGDPTFWLIAGITTGSLAVVKALLRACPAAGWCSSQYFHGATALDVATKDLWEHLASVPIEEVGVAGMRLGCSGGPGECRRGLIEDVSVKAGKFGTTAAVHQRKYVKTSLGQCPCSGCR